MPKSDLPPAPAADAPLPLAPDVFISYSRTDRARAEAIASALQAGGLTLWWDRQLEGGQDFADAIATQLGAARQVLVLWSTMSVRSGFVRDEAGRARDAGKLLPLRIDAVQLPLGFGSLHTLDLLDWDGDTGREDWQALLGALRRGPGDRASPGAPAALSRPGRPHWQRPAALGLLLLGLAGAGGYGLLSWRREQAQAQALAQAREQALAQLNQGLAAQFGRDPNLELARSAYFSALQNDPRLGRAHYHLAQVYALQSLRADALPVLRRDARSHYSDALGLRRDLDGEQIADAERQLAALDDGAQDTPLARAPGAVTVAAADTAPQPAPGRTPPTAVTSGSNSTRPPGGPGSTPDLDAILAAHPPGAGPAIAPLRVALVPLEAAAQAAIDSRVAALFGAEAAARAAAASALALSPELLSDALPGAIERSLRGLRDEPGSEAVAAGVAATLQLMQGASPATLNRHRDEALRLLDAVAPLGVNTRATAEALHKRLAALGAADALRSAPVAYLQIAHPAQRPIALALAERLRAAGYRVPAIEDLSRKPGVKLPQQPELRVQGASDQALARWLLKVTGQAVGVPVKGAVLRAAKPATDTFEIWFDAGLCVEGGRTAAGCAP